MRFTFGATLLSLFTGFGTADLVTYDWRVTSISAAFDGVSVPTLGINDKPADQAIIDVELGQEVEVRVTNELDVPTCLHWHGLKQLGTQEMDGTSEITQCHISPNATAVYRFMPDKPGTFWWHSHHSFQYAFGLRGALIVHAPANQRQPWEKDIAEEYVVQLADLYHKEPYPTRMWDTMAINNRGRYNCSAAAAHGFTECTDDQPLSRFQFEAGKKYLLRLINMAALSPIEFSIDDHEFQVVAADGDHLEPSKPINSIFLNAGHRYDIIVEAKGSAADQQQEQSQVGLFWMRAVGLHGLPWTRGNATTAGVGYNYEGLAIVSYDAANLTEPTTQQSPNVTTIGEFDFTPLVPTVLPATPSDRAILEFKMQDGKGHFAIDGGEFHHFTHPEEPPLFTIAGGLKTEQLPATANARKVEYGKHIEAVLVNVKDEQHPFHMHTHSPWVVGSGHASIEDIRNGNIRPLKLQGAMTRDVYTVPQCTSDGKGGCLDAGYLVLRFTADNPGVWILHCHIDWHLDAGLSMILVEGEQELQQRGVASFSNSMLSVCGSGTNASTFIH
ncbi:ferroxidase fet3 [Phytophthora boehmeriae]|uniref:Ferroxidase fet3 n=1 Tax=Phytophthora boehmeriae TaxID=109152 RepID=A0A8T1WTM2_9STRA|nr:ferroxidase fet3 [Phytophthora boehmeriae]